MLSGAFIGLLGGIVGLILGSLRMPALLRLVGEVPARAVGTNLAVGFWVGLAGLVGHLPSAGPDWGLLAVGAGASIPGALLGARLTGRLSTRSSLRRSARCWWWQGRRARPRRSRREPGPRAPVRLSGP